MSEDKTLIVKAAAVRRESPKPPKLTKAQHRYRDYLKADMDMPFIEWLKVTRR